ncbi:hypothetical protein VZT92_027091 [Zoarces viviparus]|uniref:Stathmin n=1 Tax=Zoarces viviparus TaxID=48416 RepID=A0AAW1DUH5_ZOAVI
MEGCGDIQVKELNKRASGQAFEVILSPTSPDAKCKSPFPLSPQKKKPTSLDEIKRKLETAEERRKSYKAEFLKLLAEKREHDKEKMEANKENRTARMASLNEKFKEKDKKLDEVRKNKEAMKEDS